MANYSSQNFPSTSLTYIDQLVVGDPLPHPTIDEAALHGGVNADQVAAAVSTVFRGFHPGQIPVVAVECVATVLVAVTEV